MISVPSLRLRLSGNNLLACLCFGMLLACMSCNPSKQAQKRPDSKDQTKEEDKTPRVYNPKTGKYEPVEDPRDLVDTVEFKEDKQTKPVESTEIRKPTKKSAYDVAFLIPFNAAGNSYISGSTDAKVRRFIHYYAGVKMALHDLSERGIKINADIYDTKESSAEANKLIQSLGEVDAVVGPYEVESLRDAASFSSRKKVPVFSPWTPSISLDDDNPMFIQLTPGLEAHAEAIVNYIDTRLSDAKVYLVARDDEREKNRLSLFRDVHKKTRSSVEYEDLIIDDASVNLTSTVLTPLVSEDRNTVFILPYYSRNDEDFVNAFIRKLHADKGTATAYVFGMPQWLTFGKMNSDYLESTNVHVSTAHYVDPKHQDVRTFQSRFLETYGTVPEPAAHQGYEFVMFLGESLDRYGTGFLDEIAGRTTAEGKFELVPVYRNVQSERQNVANYLENRAIHILRFEDQAYRRVE